MEKKNIIFVLPSLKTGGGVRVIIELSNRLVNMDINVDIVYPFSEEQCTFYIDKKVNLISIGNKSDKFDKIKNLIDVYRFISTHYRNQNVIFTDPIMSLFIPMIKNNHIHRYIQADDYRIFDDLFLLKRKSILKLYKLATKVSYKYKVNYLFNSMYTFEQFLKVSKRKDIKPKIIHPAINHEIFKDYNIRSDKEFNICIVGRRHPLKGFVDFVKAYKVLKEKIKIDNVFVISHDDLSSFDIKDFTVIKPRNDKEIAKYMNKSQIFVSTSWWEGFGLPPLEAMACGCAVILTNSGGVKEYAQHNENCLMYKPKNAEELAEKVIFLYKNKDLLNRLAKNGKLTARKFTWEKSSNQLLEFIKL